MNIFVTTVVPGAVTGSHQPLALPRLSTAPWWVPVLIFVLVAGIALQVRQARRGKRTPAMWAAGKDPAFLKSTTERAVVTSMGTIIFLVAAWATMAMTLAISIVRPGPWNYLRWLPVGMIWGAMVISIDRWIVSLPKNNPLRVEATRGARAAGSAAVLARFVMAGLVGLIISEPLLLELFKPEIRAEISSIHQKQIEDRTITINADYADAAKHPVDPTNVVATAVDLQRLRNGQLKAAQSEFDHADLIDTCETQGVKSRPTCAELARRGLVTGRPGLGDKARKAAANASTAHGRLEKAKRANAAADQGVVNARAELVANRAAINRQRLGEIAVARTAIDEDFGLAIREQALNNLTFGSWSMFFTRLVVFGALLTVDLLPLLLKLSGGALWEYEDRALAEAVARSGNLVADAQETADAAHRERQDKRRRDNEKRTKDFATQAEYEDTIRSQELATRVADVETTNRHARDLRAREHELDREYDWTRRDVEHEKRMSDLRSQWPGPAGGGTGTRGHGGGGPDDEDGPGVDGPDGVAPDDGPDGDPGGGSGGGWGQPTPGELIHEPSPGSPETAGGPAAEANLVGNRWRIIGLLSDDRSGNSVMLSLAEDTYLEYDKVVVKVLATPGHRGSDLERLFRELHAVRGTIGDHVAEVLDARDNDPIWGMYVVTKYYPDTLDKVLNPDHPQLTLDEALEITRQVLDGAISLWRRGKAHMDIKPRNVAIDEDGMCKLIDFGLVRNREQSADGQVTTQTPGYTALYSPPEQLPLPDNGVAPIVDRRAADLRAVGAVLYRMVTGRPPLQREAQAAELLTAKNRYASENAQGQLHELVRSIEPAPSEALLPFEIPLPLAQLMQRWLARDWRTRNPGDSDSFAERAEVQLAEAIAAVRAAGVGGRPVGLGVAGYGMPARAPVDGRTGDTEREPVDPNAEAPGVEMLPPGTWDTGQHELNMDDTITENESGESNGL